MSSAKKNIFLIGGGGHCESCIDVIESSGLFTIVGISDLPEKKGHKVLSYAITHSDEDIPQLCNQSDLHFLITVGHVKTVSLRQKLSDIVIQSGGKLATVVSPLAYISKFATLGHGTIVHHHAIVNANAEVGSNCILNTKSLIEHGAKIGDFCHVSTGAIVNGSSQILNSTFLGSGSVVTEGVIVPEGTFLKANERWS